MNNLFYSLNGIAQTPSYGFTIPSEEINSKIKYSNNLWIATFEEREYVLLNKEECDDLQSFFKNFSVNCAYYAGPGTERAKAHDGSWLGSKIAGEGEPYDEIVLEPNFGGTESMGKKNYIYKRRSFTS